MKKFKKIMAVLVAAIMVVAMTVPAFAAYTLTYNTNGGTTATWTDNEFDPSKAVTNTIPEHAAENGVAVKFIGWTESAKPIMKADDPAVTPTYYSDQTLTAYNNDMVLYALWGYDYNGNGTADWAETGTVAQVTFNGRGSNEKPANGIPANFTTKLSAGGSAQIKLGSADPAELPTKDGCVFVGWEMNTDTYSSDIPADTGSQPTGLKDAGAQVTITGDTVFRAVWAVDANGNGEPDYSDDPHSVNYHFDTAHMKVEYEGLVRDIQGIATTSVTTPVSVRKDTWFSLPTPSDTKGFIYDEVEDVTVYVGFIGWTTNEAESRKLYVPGGTDTYTAVVEKKMGDTDLDYYPLWGRAAGANQEAEVVVNNESGNNGTIKISAPNANGGTANPEEHEAFKIFDVTKTDANASWKQLDSNLNPAELPSGFAYTISSVTNADWYNVFSTDAEDANLGKLSEYVTLTPSTVDGVYNVAWTRATHTNEDVKNFAKLLYAQKPAGDGEKFATGETLYTQPGYYLITSSLGTNLILATSNVDVTDKNEYISDLKVVESGNATVGYHNEKYSTYYIKVNIPSSAKTTEKITVHDTLDAQLSFQSATLKVTDPGNSYGTTAEAFKSLHYGDLGAGYNLNTSPSDGCTFEIEFYPTSTMLGNSIVFTYNAELLSSADSQHEYHNKEYSTYSNYKTQESDVTVKTFALDIKKVNSSNELLGGAVFELRKTANAPSSAINFKNKQYFKDGSYLQLSTDHYPTSFEGALDQAFVADSKDVSAGTTTTKIVTKAGETLNISGLGQGTYFLVEVVAPKGYVLPTEAITVVIDDDGKVSVSGGGSTTADGTCTLTTIPEFTVTNNTNMALPATGGMGTTVLYIVGGMLVILAGAYLFFSRKRTA